VSAPRNGKYSRAVELIREAVPQESAAPRTSALSMAVQNRTPAAGDGDPLPTTSVQIGSRAFIQRAGESGLVPSRGPIAGCCGNGLRERSGSRVPVELLDRHRWRARLERANAISDHLGSRRRRHGALGRVSPVACERAHTTLAQDPETGLHGTGLHGTSGTPVRPTGVAPLHDLRHLCASGPTAEDTTRGAAAGPMGQQVLGAPVDSVRIPGRSRVAERG